MFTRALVLGATGMIGCHAVHAGLRRATPRAGARAPGQRCPHSRRASIWRSRGATCTTAPRSPRALEGCDLLIHAAAAYPKRHFGAAAFLAVRAGGHGEPDPRMRGRGRRAAPRRLCEQCHDHRACRARPTARPRRASAPRIGPQRDRGLLALLSREGDDGGSRARGRGPRPAGRHRQPDLLRRRVRRPPLDGATARAARQGHAARRSFRDGSTRSRRATSARGSGRRRSGAGSASATSSGART